MHSHFEYFDPNVTSHIQPLDMGIIRSFKAHYRKALVRHCLKTMWLLQLPQKKLMKGLRTFQSPINNKQTFNPATLFILKTDTK